MADNNDQYQGLLGGLLGGDPEQLKALLAQFQPSEADRRAALTPALLAASAGFFGGRGLGNALQQGIGGGAMTYQESIRNTQAQRLQNIQGISAMLPLLRQAQMDKMLQGVKWEGTNPNTPPQPYAQSTQAAFGMQPSTQAAVQGAFNDPAGVQPPVNTMPAPVPPRPGASGGANTGNRTIDMALNVGIPPAAIQMVLSGDPNGMATLGKMIADYGKPENLRASGSMVNRDPITGQVKVLYRAPTLAEGQTVDAQGNAIDVPGAQEALFRQTMRPHVATALSTPQETLLPGGGKGYTPGMSRANVLWPDSNVPGFGGIPGAGPQGAQQGNAQPAPAQRGFDVNLRGRVTPAQLRAIADDYERMHGGSSAQAAPLALSPPGRAIQPRVFQTELSPQAQAESKSYGDALTKRWEEIATGGRNGAFASARWGEMQKLAGQFDSGAFTPYRARIASYFNAAGASADTVSAVAGGSLPAMEGFGKLAFESTLNQIKAFSARPAMQEVVLAMQNNPNIQMTVPGRNLLLQTNKALADYNVAMYKAAKDYRQKYGTIDGFEEQYLDQRPPESVLPSLEQIEAASSGARIPGLSGAAGNGAPQVSTSPNVVTLPDGRQKTFPSRAAAAAFKRMSGLQ